jgi:hypothetical protein
MLGAPEQQRVRRRRMFARPARDDEWPSVDGVLVAGLVEAAVDDHRALQVRDLEDGRSGLGTRDGAEAHEEAADSERRNQRSTFPRVR